MTDEIGPMPEIIGGGKGTGEQWSRGRRERRFPSGSGKINVVAQERSPGSSAACSNAQARGAA